MTNKEDIYPSAMVRAAKFFFALLLILVVGYFYLQEFKKNPIDFSVLTGSVNVYYLASALFLCLMSFLIDAVIWKVIINNQRGRQEISTSELLAILNSSGLFRYLPGRMWTIMAQSLWLKKYGITKPLVLYINLVFIIGSTIFSLYLGLLYLAIYSSSIPTSIIIILFLALSLATILYNVYNNRIMNTILVLLKKITRVEMQLIRMPLNSMIIIQCIIAFNWIITGLEACLLAKGLGLQIDLMDTIPVTASMSLSWLAGFVAVVIPAGLGVREGMMLVMLKPVLAAKTALLLPIMSRILLLLTQALLGFVALYLGIKNNVFALSKDAGNE